jgi:hypothetical protein
MLFWRSALSIKNGRRTFMGQERKKERERKREEKRERSSRSTYLVAEEYVTSYHKTPNLIKSTVTIQPHYNRNIGFIIYLNCPLFIGSCNIFYTKERKSFKSNTESKKNQ